MTEQNPVVGQPYGGRDGPDGATDASPPGGSTADQGGRDEG